MVAELKTPTIEFRIVTSAEEARALDPQGLPWGDGNAIVFAIENGKVVGRSAAIAFPMIETSWVAPEKRGSTLAMRLVKEVEKIQRDLGNAYVFAFVHDSQPEIAGYLLRFGYEPAQLKLYCKKLAEDV